ncbi:MAG: family 20 glycosylhydrolase [candidate division FCPU426 bacterium]
MKLIRLMVCLGTPLLASCASTGGIVPQPKSLQALSGKSAEGPLKVEKAGSALSREASGLWKTLESKAPGGKPGAEAYALQTLSQGALVVASTDAGVLRAKQSLKQMAAASGARPMVSVVDWPQDGWRGLHVLDSGAKSLPELKRLIHEVMAPAKANVLIYEIDYSFQFKSHPEIRGEDPWSVEQVRELVAAAREEGIQVIPQMNCLGHQSWKEPPGALLKAHPEFEEIPDGTDPHTTLGNPEFYCRSWCPLHPQINAVVFDLMDEVIAAFGSKSFHVGMDEVFVLASKKCPRCKGKSTAELFARSVNDLHGHLSARGVTMLMWADRFLDGDATGYGEWEASKNGTFPALDRVPKDIILCDWHYDNGAAGRFPSVDLFLKKGFKVWPTVYKNLQPSYNFMNSARAAKDPGMLGTLASVWIPGAKVAGALLGGEANAHERQVSRVALQVLQKSWE